MPRMSHMIHIKLGRAFASLAAAATLTLFGSRCKAAPRSAEPAIMESAAAFIPKPLVADSLRGRASIAQLAEGAHVIAWDGETKLGVIKPKAWADDFMLTYKVAGYTPDPRVTCP